MNIDRGREYNLKNNQWFTHNLFNLLVFSIIITLMLLLAWWINQLHIGFSLLIGIPTYAILFFALYILVVHEASHQMFLITTNKKSTLLLNRLFAYPISALSFQDFYHSWERGHYLHHQKPIEQDDPQNCPKFCSHGRELWRECLKTLFKFGYAFTKQSSCIHSNKKAIILGLVQGLAVWSLLAYSLINLGYIKVFLAMILSSNLTMVLNLIKVSMEHGGVTKERSDFITRSKSSTFTGRWLLMPLNISLHFEHHLNPSIPWYRLGSYHRKLVATLPVEAQKIIFNNGSKETWSQITTGRSV
jgi:fatty acid desaturase